MKEKVKIGYIGLGRRGRHVLENCMILMEDAQVAYLCDMSEKRMVECRDLIREKNGYEPKLTGDYREILRDPEVDAVMVMTGWSGRPQIARDAMLAGKYTGIEVGCSDSLDECFELLEVYERTKSPLMMLENCCYGRRELLALNMARQGLFGEIVHCTGGYHHELTEAELFKNLGEEEIPHYRLAEYMNRNRENYPTHELGPISKLLKINRGNRLVSLCSVASKSRGLKTAAARKFGAESPYARADYRQGDIVDTLITCAGGETVRLTLDTTLPRPYYSRNFCVRGTEGMLSEEGAVVFLVGMERKIRDNEADFYEKYDHPLQREYQLSGAFGGHGGMDGLVCSAFVDSVKRGVDTPINAYDTLTWMSIGALSEASIAAGGAPQEIPDFTGGKWRNPPPSIGGKYCLD